MGRLRDLVHVLTPPSAVLYEEGFAQPPFFVVLRAAALSFDQSLRVKANAKHSPHFYLRTSQKNNSQPEVCRNILGPCWRDSLLDRGPGEPTKVINEIRGLDLPQARTVCNLVLAET